MREVILMRHKQHAMKNCFFLSIIVCLLAAAPSRAQNSLETQATLAGIAAVHIVVEPTSPQLDAAGITAGVLQAEVHRQLKHAGITVLRPSEEALAGNATVYVNVTAVMDDTIELVTYSVRLELQQLVRLERDPKTEEMFAPTWGVGGVATHLKGWRTALVDDVLGYTEEFIDAYFEANPDVQ